MTSFVEAARREKLQELVKRGVAPFAYRFERTGTARDAGLAYRGDDDPTVHRLAGRLVALRPHGKTTFAHLADQSGRIQLYFKVDDFGAGPYEVLSLLDLGDFVGVEGRLFKTRTGEITVRAEQLTLLTKALRPLPLGKEDASGVRHGELSDPEVRYRQRYADLAVHAEVREVFRLRTRVVTAMRAFLDARGYLEVETPVLQPLYGGAMARPFTTHHNTLDATFYLRIATELYLKRCIVGGLERVYEIGKDFRNEGIDRLHNPEFTMLEFYEAYADYHDVMSLIEQMISGLVHELYGSHAIERFGKTFDFAPPWRRATWVDLVREHSGIQLRGADDSVLRQALERRGVPDVALMPRTRLIDE